MTCATTEAKNVAGLSGLVLIAALLLATTGCANYAQFETAEALGYGESKAGGGVTLTRYDTGYQPGDEADLQVTVPAVMAWYRYGLMEGFEVRAAMWIPMGGRIGAKYQLVGANGEEGFDLSVGADFSYNQTTIGSGDDATEITYLDLYLPVQTGYRMTPALAAYFTPKFIGGLRTGDIDTTFAPTPAATAGIALGEDTQFHIEGTGGYDFQAQGPVFTAGLGVAF